MPLRILLASGLILIGILDLKSQDLSNLAIPSFVQHIDRQYRLSRDTIEVSVGEGLPWNPLSTIHGVKLLAWDVRRSMTLFAMTNGNCLEVSHDGGRHWIIRLSRPTSFIAEKVSVDGNNPYLVVLEGTDIASSGSRILERWRSVNGGRDWIRNIDEP